MANYDLEGEVLPIYTDVEIYQTLWALARAGLFNQKVVINIITSYLASNLNCDDIFNTKLLIPIFNNKPKTDNLDEVKDVSLKKFVIDEMGEVINKLKREVIEQLLQPYDCLNKQSYIIIEDFILRWTYNAKANKIAGTQNNIKIFVLHEQQREFYIEQTIIKLDYGKNSWEKYNQMLPNRKS